MYLIKLILLEALFIMLLSNCSSFSSDKDVIKSSPLPTIKNQFTPLIMWSSPVGNGIGNFYSNLHPAFSKNIVYAADRNGTVLAFNANNGKKVWSLNLAKKNGVFTHTPALLSGGLTVSGDHVYISSEKAQVYALNTKDGSIAWQVSVAGEALSCPVVKNGIVFIHTNNGQLQALNEANGTIKWTLSLNIPSFSLRGESTPAFSSDRIIIGNDNGYISTVLMQHGQIIWQQCISQAIGTTEVSRLNDVDTTPVIIDGIIYAFSYNGNLTALNLYSGQIIWKHKFGSVNNFVINNDRIYIVDQNDQVLALNTKGNMIIWSQRGLLHRVLTAPVIYNGNLVVGDNEGYIHWINQNTGCFVAQQKIDRSGFLTQPVVVDNKLLIQSKNGTLYSICSAVR